jgi:hypothetical protein
MAKKKQTEQDQEKAFEVIPAVYDQFNWPVGWEYMDRPYLEETLLNCVIDLGYHPNEPKDFVLHETLNSFKGNSDNLKAFLFLDTADNGGMIVYGVDGAAEDHINPVKGYLVVIKGYEYSFVRTLSAKRRVLELIF